MTPEQLKASILQYAMEGKLVKQDPNDEPASILLEKIKAEKEKLIKEGKIKKSRKLPPVKNDEKPFKIPDSWEWVRLGTISDRIGDGLHGTPKYSKLGKVPFINGSNLKNNTIIIDTRTKFVDDEEYKKYKLPLNQNTIFISLNGTLGNLAKYSNQKLVLGKSAGYVSLTSNKIFSYIYLFLATPVFVRFYRANYTGTTIKNIPLRALRQCLVPIPPLNEQHRIVAKIEKLMPLVDKYAEAYNRLKAIDDSFDDKLKQSILQYAMEGKLVKQDPNDEPASVLLKKINAEKGKLVKAGKIKKSKKLPPIKDSEKPFKIPTSWEWVRLGNLFSFNDRNKNIDDDLDVAFIPMKMIQDGFCDKYAIQKKKWGKIKKGYTHIKNGNLLIAKITPCFQNKKSCIVDDLPNSIGAATTEVYSLAPFCKIETRLYLYFVKSAYFIESGKNNFSGTAGQQRVPRKFLEKFVFPLPPFNEQKRIVAKIDKLFQNIKNFN